MSSSGQPPAGGESITAEGLHELEAELAELEGPARKRMAERIKAAREHGDLKENADYHIAKEDQAHLETKIIRLRARLRDAVVVAAEDGDPDRFAFGRTAEVADDAGAVHTWTLVGATEADMAAGRLSAESPVGRALRDGRVGADIVVETPRGSRTFTIRKLIT
jgi:transcription elongation factor GreA